jgi:hypothetical protein
MAGVFGISSDLGEDWIKYLSRTHDDGFSTISTDPSPHTGVLGIDLKLYFSVSQSVAKAKTCSDNVDAITIYFLRDAALIDQSYVANDYAFKSSITQASLEVAKENGMLAVGASPSLPYFHLRLLYPYFHDMGVITDGFVDAMGTPNLQTPSSTAQAKDWWCDGNARAGLNRRGRIEVVFSTNALFGEDAYMFVQTNSVLTAYFGQSNITGPLYKYYYLDTIYDNTNEKGVTSDIAVSLQYPK